jgi:SAM-dependent methyltransferase
MIPVAFELDDSTVESELESRVGPAGKWTQARNAQLKLLSRLGLEPHMSLVDVGCGPLRAGLQLIAYLEKGCYTGIDIDPGSIQAAKELIKKYDLTSKDPTVLHSATFGQNELKKTAFADRIWCYQVMIHMSKGIVLDCLESMSKMLKPGGIAWTTARVREGGTTFDVTGKWRTFPISEGGSEFFAGAAADVGLKYKKLEWGNERGFSSEGSTAVKTLIEFTKL